MFETLTRERIHYAWIVAGPGLDSSFGRAMALRLRAPFLLWLLVGIAGVLLLAGILVSLRPPA